MKPTPIFPLLLVLLPPHVGARPLAKAASRSWLVRAEAVAGSIANCSSESTVGFKVGSSPLRPDKTEANPNLAKTRLGGVGLG